MKRLDGVYTLVTNPVIRAKARRFGIATILIATLLGLVSASALPTVTRGENGASSPNRLWSSGAELNSTTADVEVTNTSGTVSISSSTKRSGSYAYRANPTSSTGTFYKTWADSAQNNKFWFRTYIRVATTPGTTTGIMQIGTGSTARIGVRLTTALKLQLYNETGTPAQIGSDSAALTTSTWYRVEVYIDDTTSTATAAELRLDGSSVASTGSTNIGTSVGVDRLTWGVVTSTTSDIYFDDLAVNDSTGSSTNWPGEGKIVHLLADSAGDNTNWTRGGTDSGANWSQTNDGTPNDDTNYVATQTANLSDDYNLASATSAGIGSNDLISVVSVGFRIRNCGKTSGPCPIIGSNQGIFTRLKASSGGTTEESAEVTIPDSDLTWYTNDDDAAKLNPLTVYDLPGSSVTRWTTSDLDSAQIGFRTSNTNNPSGNRVSAAWLQVEYIPTTGGRIFTSGFELNSTTANMEWTSFGSNTSIVTSPVRSGTYSARINPTSASGSFYYDFASSNTNANYYARTYIRFASLPSATVNILSFDNASGTTMASFKVTSAGHPQLGDEDNSNITSDSNTTFVTGKWYRLELRLDLSQSAGSQIIDGRINGYSFGSASNRDISTGIARLELGQTSSATNDYTVDDVAINQAAGNVQNAWPGSGKVIHLSPNAAGDNSAWTNDYTTVDETPPNDATDFASETTTNDILDVNVADSPLASTDTVTLVSVGARFNTNGGAEEDFRTRLKDSSNGVVVESSTINAASSTWKTNATAAPYNYSLTAYTRPESGVGWTDTELDSAQIGVRDMGGSDTIQVSALWLLVEYVPTPFIVSGTIYSDEGSTAYNCSSDNLTIGGAIAGGVTYKTTCDQSSGAYSITFDDNPSSSDPIAVWIDSGETPKATTVTLTNITSGTISGLNMYQSRLIVRHETAGPISNSNLSTADNTEAGIRYSVASSNLTVESGIALYVWTGKTFTPGGTVTTDTTGGDVKIASSATLNMSSNALTIGGSYTNSGTATLSNTVTFNATSSGKTVSGTLNGSSAFNKIAFSGSGGSWTITDPILVSAADATDTFVIGNGTVTLGDGNGDNLDLRGKMTIAATANQTGTFQTAALSEGSSITIDVNANSSTPLCTNCIISVGATSGTGQGNLIISKNTVVRLNPKGTVTGSDTGIEAESTGYLEIQGSLDYSGTSTSATNSSLTDTGKSWTTNENANKYLRMTSGFAKGRFIPITSNTATTLSFATSETTSLTMDSIGGTGVFRRICSNSTTIASSNDQFAGYLLEDKTGSTGHLLVYGSINGDSNCTASHDSFIVAQTPDSFSILATNDTFTLSYGILSGDGYEVIDPAQVTAENGTSCNAAINNANGEGYIFGKTGSQTLIRYAYICNLGRNFTNHNGISFGSMDNSQSNQGVTIQKSYLYSNRTSLFSSTSGGVQNIDISNNYIAANTAPVSLSDSSSADDSISSNLFENSSTSQASITLSAGVRYTFQNNTTLYHQLVADGTTDSTFSGNSFFAGLSPNSTVHSFNSARSVVSSNNFYEIDQAGTAQAIVNSTSGDNLTFRSNTILSAKTSGTTVIGLQIGSGSGITLQNNTIKAIGLGVKLTNTSTRAVMSGNTIAENTDGLFLNNNSEVVIGINDSYSSNSTADISLNSTTSNVTLYNTTLGSTTETTGVPSATGYIISRKHDSTAGATRIWGSYAIPSDDTRTPMTESTEQYNYTDALWGKSVTPSRFSGTGTEDTNLSFDLSSATLSSGPYVYRVVAQAGGTSNCVTPTVFDVYRNGTDTGQDATCNSLFTDSTTSVKFTIQGGATAYTRGATYLFTAYDASGDTSTNKTVSFDLAASNFTVGSGKTVEIKGTSSGTATTFTRGSANAAGWYMAVAGTINAQYFSMSYLGGTGGAIGLDLQSGATVTGLEYGTFDNYQNVGATDTYIRVFSTLIGSGTPDKTLTGNTFVQTSSNPEFTVTESGGTAGSGYWLFASTLCTNWSSCENSDSDTGAGNGTIQFTAPGITISGTIYSDEGSTAYNCATDNLTIGVSVNGGTTATTTCTVSGGTYSITVSQPSAAGDPIAVWIDSAETPKATGVTLAADTTSNITGFDLYQNRLIVRHEDSGPITNSKLGTADNGDAGIRYSVSAGALTVESGITLYTWTGKTFTPGGSVTTSTTSGDVKIASSATLSLGSNTLTIGGSYTNSGTLTAGTSTVAFNATATGKTISGTLNGASAFYNVTFTTTDATATDDWEIQATMSVGNDFTINSGNVDSNSNNLSVTRDFTIANATNTDYDAGSSTVTVTRNWSDANNKFTEGTASTVSLNGTGNLDEGGNFFALSVASSGKTTTVVQAITVNGGLTVNGGTFTASSSVGVSLFCTTSCTPFTFASPTTIDASGGGTIGLVFQQNGNATTTVPGGNYGNATLSFRVNGTGLTSAVVQLGGNVTTTGSANTRVNASGTTTGATFNTQNNNLTAASFTSGTSAATNSWTCNFGSSTVTFTLDTDTSGSNSNGGSHTWNLQTSSWSVAGNLRLVNGTGTTSISAGTSTVDFTKTSGTQTLTDSTGGTTLNNLTHSGAGTLSITTNPLTVSNDLNNSGGSLSSSVNTTVNGSATGVGALTMTGSTTFEQRIAANKNFGTTSGSNDWTFVNLTFSNSHASTGFTVTTQTGGSGGIIVSGNLLVGKSGDASGATTTLDAGNRTWTLSSTGGDPFQLLSSPAGSLTGNSSTFSYTGNNAGGNTTVQSATYYNLTTNNASETYVLEAATTASNDLTITAGTLDTVSGQNYGLTIGHNYSNSGTFTAQNGTVTLNGSSKQTLSGTMTSSSAFYNLTVTNSSGANASDCERTGFTPSVDFDAAATATHNLTFTTASTRVEFNSGSTYTFTNINWNGQASGTKLYFRNSATSGTWLLNVSGTQTAVSYINVSRSDASSGNTILAADGTNTNCNNNTNWDFNAPNVPTSLAQKKTDNTTSISTGGWTNETSVIFSATVSDTDNPDTLQICVEKDLLGTSFSNTEDSCSSGVSYTGTGVTASVTIGSLTDTAQYHWQARVKDVGGYYSSWMSFGGNLETDQDFGIDTTACTYSGTVYDGSTTDVDAFYNDNSLTSLSANWDSFSCGVSGLSKYEYSIGTSVGGTDIKNWTDNTTSTSYTASSLNLHTNQRYFANVRATDNAGNLSSTFSSDGQEVLPFLTFTLGSNTVTFSNLNDTNSRSDTKTTGLTTSTNAYGGYVISQYASGLLTSGSNTIPMFSAGSYASPASWASGFCSGSTCGYGYTSNDPTIQGSNKFNSGTLYAPFSTTASGDIVADHTTAVNGTSGAVSNESFTITHKVAVDALQTAKTYNATVYYIVTGTF